MSSFTFADNKLGGRLMTATDAIAAGKLRTAAGILNELAEELNVEAETTDGLMADDPVEWPVKATAVSAAATAEPPTPTLAVKGQPVPSAMDTQSCAKGAHSYGEPDPISGWRTCRACGYVYVSGGDGGAVDMSARPLGDYA